MTGDQANGGGGTSASQRLLGLAGRVFLRARIQRLTMRGKAVVVAFHRVNDLNAGDGLTVGVNTFDAYCRMFAEEFRVVSLSDLVGKLERSEPLAGELAITFDDGYRDNFEEAAPVLERYGLPACFFVTTTFIESDVVPWWDEKMPAPPNWMSWDQVRGLRERGFEVGAHTRTHADLGVVDGPEADDEIAGARAELEKRLGDRVDLFAYPYGRRENISETNRSRIRDAGFRSCVSCFGGLTRTETDPLRIPRVAVTSWYTSAHRFGLDVALDRC